MNNNKIHLFLERVYRKTHLEVKSTIKKEMVYLTFTNVVNLNKQDKSEPTQ